MLQTKAVRKIKTHILCSITPPENCAICETCKNIVDLDTRSKYVIRIAFPLQQWLHECSHCYVIVCIVVVDGAKRHAESHSVLRCVLDDLA
jgi:hypothetical protein